MMTLDAHLSGKALVLLGYDACARERHRSEPYHKELVCVDAEKDPRGTVTYAKMCLFRACLDKSAAICSQPRREFREGMKTPLLASSSLGRSAVSDALLLLEGCLFRFHINMPQSSSIMLMMQDSALTCIIDLRS